MSEFRLIIKQDEVDPEAAQVLVDGKIGGNPYRFLLDTGAARTSVVLDEYTSTFDSLDTHDSSGVFAISSDDVITVPSIEVGPVTKEPFTVTRKADTEYTSNNLIGMDVLKDLCCHFYFDENRVAINVSVDASADYTFNDLLLDTKAHPYLTVQFGNVKADAVWDTGAGITIADLNFIEKYPSLFQAAGTSTGMDATGTRVETPMFIMEAPKIGNYTFPPSKVAGVDLSPVNARIEIPMVLILGYNILRRANWIFDFSGKRWAISKLLHID